MEPKGKGEKLQFELNNREVKESSDGYGMQLRGISPTDYAGLSEWVPLESLSEIFKDYFSSQVTKGIKVKVKIGTC